MHCWKCGIIETTKQATSEISKYGNHSYRLDDLIDKSQIIHSVKSSPIGVSQMQLWLNFGIKSVENIIRSDMIANTVHYSDMQGLLEIQATMEVNVNFPTHLPCYESLHISSENQILYTQSVSMDIAESPYLGLYCS